MIGVWGATGHTGRMVAHELERRGLRAVLIGRDEAKIARLREEHPGRETRAAALDDAAAVDRSLVGVSLVINCASPFLDTAPSVVAAALRARAHYLDVTAEQACAEDTFARFADAARAAGVAVVPAMAFFGGLGDLVVTLAAGDWTTVDEVDIAIALDRWWPTPGTRQTGARNTARRFFLEGGTRAFVGDPPRERAWTFPAPHGEQVVRELPFTEMVLLARHLPARTVRSYLNLAPLRDLHDQATPAPEGRTEQRFALDVRVRKGGHERRATATGQDIYAASASLVVEAAARLAGERAPRSGVLAPAEIFAPGEFLASLKDALTIER